MLARLIHSTAILGGSEQNSRFKHGPRLRRIHAVAAEHQSRCRAVRSDMGELGAHEVDLVLIGRRHRDRPRLAAWTVQQISRAICRAAGAGDVLEANGQADPGQGRVFGKAVIRHMAPP